MKDFFDVHTADDFVGRSCRDCYAEYAKWCVENGVEIMTTMSFGKTIREKYDVIGKQTRIDSKHVRRIYTKGNNKK